MTSVRPRLSPLTSPRATAQTQAAQATTTTQTTTTQTTTTTTTKPTATPLPTAQAVATPQAMASTVKASLQALHATDAEAAAAKQKKLLLSPFAFFRGTVELFAARHASTSPGAQVLLNGDVHPMNFGVVDRGDGTPVVALNDFDEACRGSFSYDVKRGAAGFALLSDEQKLSPKARRDVVQAFVDGYLDAVSHGAAGKKTHAVIDEDSSSGAVKDGLRTAGKRSRKDLLDDVTDGHGALKLGPGLIARPALKAAVEQALQKSAPGGEGAHFYVVKDVVEKSGAGIGSLGARRFLVLIEGDKASNADDVLLELKEARAPALLSSSPTATRIEALRVVRAAAAQTGGTDRFSSTTSLDGRSFIVRERSPLRMPLDLFSMDKGDLEDVAAACGAVLAGAHLGAVDDPAKRAALAERIVRSVDDKDVFKDAVVDFAAAEANDVAAAFKAFAGH